MLQRGKAVQVSDDHLQTMTAQSICFGGVGAPLTLDHQAQVHEPCRSCLFWSTDAVSRARPGPGEETEVQEAWLSFVLREWGSCGRVALVDGQVVGHAVDAPQVFLPGAAGIATAPPSPDAVPPGAVYSGSRR